VKLRNAKIDTKLNQSKGTEFVVPCSRCSGKTYHIVMQSVEVSGYEDFGLGNFFAWNDTFQIIQCLGCKTISFRHINTNSEDVYQVSHNECENVINESLYPSRVEGRRTLEDTHFLPYKVRLIYEETVSSLSNHLHIMTGVGLRAVIETVCNDKAAVGKNLNEKIDDLVKKNMLTQDGAEILHKLRNIGNKAAHEVEPHSEDQLILAMDVVEHLLTGAYILPAKSGGVLN
jgi:hypothetical protein